MERRATKRNAPIRAHVEVGRRLNWPSVKRKCIIKVQAACEKRWSEETPGTKARGRQQRVLPACLYSLPLATYHLDVDAAGHARRHASSHVLLPNFIKVLLDVNLLVAHGRRTERGEGEGALGGHERGMCDRGSGDGGGGRARERAEGGAGEGAEEGHGERLGDGDRCQ